MPDPALLCEGLAYRYPEARVRALDSLDLRIEPGELVVLAGRSGSGKSTLLRAACGLVPHFHGGEISGRLEVAGMDVRRHGPAELAAAVGVVSQEPESQVVSTTVRAEVELPLELRGAPAAARARAVEEVALALAIDGLLGRATDTLSGGELQRVALAAALVTRPSLVLLDEPTSQLDPVAGDELVTLLRRLNRDWGIAVLLGEHRLERCLGVADRVLALERGTIAFDGSPGPFLEWALDRAPALATPSARLFRARGLPAPADVRAARRALSARGVELPARLAGRDAPQSHGDPGRDGASLRRIARIADLWVELGAGSERVEALRGVDLELAAGERVALMGANGAGKSTLLRTIAGLAEPARGLVEAPAEVALLPQRPDDLLVRERVGEELPGGEGARALALVGLEGIAERDPRDLSGGERQRLALAIVIAGRDGGEGDPPALVLLDEPTRGMDRHRKQDLSRLAERLAGLGSAVVVATHDVEFAAGFADRVVLLGRGAVVADGPTGDVLGGGWYFSTEVARILGGAAVTVEEGAALLARAGDRPATGGRNASPAGGSR